MPLSPPTTNAVQRGQRPDFCRILLIGENGSGKTSLITRFIFNAFPPQPSSPPTPRHHHRTHRLISSQPCIIELVEAEPHAHYSRNGNVNETVVREIAKADAVVLCYSICGLRWHPLHREVERERDAWRRVPLEGVRRLAGLVRRERVRWDGEGQGEREEGFRERNGVVMMVLGCQKDREDLRIVRVEDGKALAAELGCGFSEVEVESGWQDFNVVIDSLVTQVRQSRKLSVVGGQVGCSMVVESQQQQQYAGTGSGFWERIMRR